MKTKKVSEFRIPSVLTFKALNGMAPQYISVLLTPYKPAGTLCSSNKLLLQVPCYRLKTYGYRSFQVTAPILWNSFPLTIKKSISVNNFKSVLKQFYSNKFWLIIYLLIQYSIITIGYLIQTVYSKNSCKALRTLEERTV